MNIIKNKDVVQYDDPYFGKGKGAVIGKFEDKEKGIELVVIYPKNPFAESFWPWMTFVLPVDKIVVTPF